jgi:hypothetical protein
VRGLFDLHDPASPRLDIALRLLSEGYGFGFLGVVFRKQAREIWCEAVSPWHGPGLHEADALRLIESARDAFARLVAAAPYFAAVADTLEPHFAIIQDDEISSAIVAEMVGGQLKWHLHRP